MFLANFSFSNNQLQTLNLAYNNITSVFFNSLTNNFYKNSKISKLIIKGNKLQDVNPDFISQLFTNNCLDTFNVSDCCLSNEIIEFIFKELTFSKIKSLDISNNKMSIKNFKNYIVDKDWYK